MVMKQACGHNEEENVFSQISHKLTTIALMACVLMLFTVTALAQGPDPNDLKPGSVLFFNRYTSSSSNPSAHDTQINITNVSATQKIDVHMFFVDGSTCSVADSYLSLTQSQTSSFLASDFDPGTTGYLVIVASSGGLPTQFNNLLGTAYIRESDGKLADIPAVAIQKIAPGTTGIVQNDNGSATMKFDGAVYGQLPAMVAVSAFNSQTTDNTSVSLYSPANSLMIGESPSISIFALMYNDVEVSRSITLRISCYTTFTIKSLRVLSGLDNFIPRGRTGWMKMSATSSRPLLGVVMNRGPAFNGGRNLSVLSLLNSYEIAVPAF